jgi:diadenosine tetraphosphate (Ap4A) HIT family hydrolase
MSSWREPDLWAKWIRGDDCPICHSLRSGDAVAELEVTTLMMSEDAPMRGYAWLPFRRHVVELHDLSDAEGTAFMRDIRRVSQAIAAATSPVKLNYEIHGNTVPHLHLHIFPRYVGDPFEGGPVNPRLVRTPVYAPGEFAGVRADVLANLHNLRGSRA